MIKTIDLFCGCGGLSLGFQKEGFEIVRAYDMWDKALSVYNDNFSHPTICTDLSLISPSEISVFNPDVIIGGPPCQDFSSAGKQNEDSGRANLTLIYSNIVSSIKPRWFVMENVDRIIKSQTLPKAIQQFKDAGYGLTRIILDSSLCGVPQKRKRFFLIGELNGEDNFLYDILINNLAEKPLTIHDYLGMEFNTEFYYRHPRSYQRRGIFSIYEPSPTIRGVNRPIPPLYKCHIGDATHDLSKARPLTTIERSRIQTFPQTFKFQGSKTNLEQIIGNAVPVELASYIAKELYNYINNKTLH